LKNLSLLQQDTLTTSLTPLGGTQKEMTTSSLLRRFPVLLLLATFAACSGGSGDNPSPELPQPTPPGTSVRPNAGNTGVPTGTALRAWPGGSVLADSDVVLDGHDYAALPAGSYYRLTGSNVTLRNCRIASGLLIQRARNVRVERCEIVGGVSLSGSVDVVLDRNNIHGSGDDLLHVTSDTGRVRNVTMSNNFVHEANPRCGAHADGIQVRGVDQLVLFNNVIDMGPWRQVCGQDALNAAVFLEDANGGNVGITLNENFLNGGGHTLRVGPSATTRIVRNKFGRDERYGPVLVTATPGSIIEAAGNARDDTGEPIRIP
jgi:Right handed beta helix region